MISAFFSTVKYIIVSLQVLFHFAQLLMNKDRLLHDPMQTFARILRLYYLAMNHAELYDCLKILYAQTGMMPTRTALCSVVKELYCKPRTLKQVMCFLPLYNLIRKMKYLPFKFSAFASGDLQQHRPATGHLRQQVAAAHPAEGVPHEF